jgi:hypothetical protein
MHICRNGPNTRAIFADFAVYPVTARPVAAGLIYVAYIAIRSISTTLLSSSVIACPITAGFIRPSAAGQAGAAHAFITFWFPAASPAGTTIATEPIRVAQASYAARAVAVVIIVAILALYHVALFNGALTC